MTEDERHKLRAELDCLAYRALGLLAHLHENGLVPEYTNCRVLIARYDEITALLHPEAKPLLPLAPAKAAGAA